MTPRERAEQREDRFLHPMATRSAATRGRERPEDRCTVRMEFQRDRDRIVHSKSFRRLSRKTQVFLNPDGDHYRTRMTHTLEVTQIARTIARALHLNEDLVEAIALGHDLGHTPFGHSGEAVLNKVSRNGFHHAVQSLRVVEHVESGGEGLNLTWEVRDGILRHTKGKGPILTRNPDALPATLEGQIVRLSDILAYVNHDLEDALRANLLSEADIPPEVVRHLGATHRERIGNLILSVIESTDLEREPIVLLSDAAHETLVLLRNYLYEHCYDHPTVRVEFEKAERLLRDLWTIFSEKRQWTGLEGEFTEEKLVDYLAGMTDRYAIRKWESLFVPQSWFVKA
ncbi:MAG: deoxyguanosinetriphosphate triphosphohydrolase [Deltaproteobacteria bacterium HGW-Deltaproteobacteria-17]|nr:MAG: deoxyguanosinetriphosphate triphosphohydrolase [Deltaproteobacteria bacterium HGW-Deltaproteobacteria-17]